MSTTGTVLIAQPLTAMLSGIHAQRTALLAVAIAALLTTLGAAAQPVTLDVRFKLTDLDYKPLAGVPVRLVFGSGKGWQEKNAGQRATTDANGEARLTATVTIDKQMRKVPTSFIGSLLSGPRQADHIAVGAELPTMGFHWLYVVDLARFESGDVMLDDTSIYTPDEKGDFTRKATNDASGWHMPELGNLVLTAPVYQPWDYALEPDASAAARDRWKLRIAFKKAPEPVRR